MVIAIPLASAVVIVFRERSWTEEDEPVASGADVAAAAELLPAAPKRKPAAPKRNPPAPKPPAAGAQPDVE